jgi:transcriptional regulator of NAD metabolism
MTENLEQKLNELIEQERQIITKLNQARRLNSSYQIIDHLEYLLNENRFTQQEIRYVQKSDRKDSDFDNYLSVG